MSKRERQISAGRKGSQKKGRVKDRLSHGSGLDGGASGQLCFMESTLGIDWPDPCAGISSSVLCCLSCARGRGRKGGDERGGELHPYSSS